MKTSKFIYGAENSKGYIKKNVLDKVQELYEKGQRQFTYTEVHDLMLDFIVTDWRTYCQTINESRFAYRGQHTGMFSNQAHSGRNCMCMPNQWDSRHLIKIKKGVYELSF